MSIYTVIVSRGMSKNPNKSGRLALGQVSTIIKGEKEDVFSKTDLKKEMRKTVYWRTGELSDSEFRELNSAIHSGGAHATIRGLKDPKRIVTLVLAPEEKEKLKTRGLVSEKLGGTITRDSFIISLVEA